MGRENGNKLVTTHFQVVIGTFRKISWNVIKNLRKEGMMNNNIILTIRSNFDRKNTKMHSFSGYRIMLLVQPVKVFWSSVAIQVASIHRPSPNTKTEAGRMLETWLKLGMLMVQSPLDLPQWLLVDIQMMEKQRKCISQHENSIILIFSVRIRNCGNSTLWKAKPSIQHYQ